MIPLPVRIAGTGVHLPSDVVTNRRLAETLDTSDEWIVHRTGIRERRWLAPDLATSDMCVAAAFPALAAANCAARDVDAIIVATYTYDQPLPSTALIVKDALGAFRALTFDITQAACANGVQALFLGSLLVRTGAAKRVLVIAGDCASRVTDPEDRTTRVFFGDAAGAAVLTEATTPGTGLLGWDFGAELSYDVEIPAGGSRQPAGATTFADRRHYLKMNGRAVWDTATRCLPDSVTNATAQAGLTVDEVSHFFVHQANLNIVRAAMDKLGVPRDRAPITVDTLGNTGSAGVFTVLHKGFSAGMVRPGDTFVVSAIGAGFQWGTLCFRA
ncbi:3-oxoacyl-ACP synthase III family protein [Amycolatopsis decaplanina]|uniref:3-oxoacyl-(Acyl-carrier-protein) synthase III n=1 Tax=Amycolatopsis decaplanina DSM 44594 TaxID=1284240 RepID=M2WWB9_9PSEU|nr:ketoacyl-ACP synthase III [Amycolatopsis decaplanina]EME53036.1 3-oxoacyl-(acyl-carrier-protein) synthase III [Amycolatopsis decaplanina DSM 44594]